MPHKTGVAWMRVCLTTMMTAAIGSIPALEARVDTQGEHVSQRINSHQGPGKRTMQILSMPNTYKNAGALNSRDYKYSMLKLSILIDAEEVT
mmetsp:Transcript_46721/g.141567  ORF Transcript_46721/g.141567 Transcript_46721/m.141567 type:complete len:92 (+) Transcript_46721:1754-2029(+)